MAKDFSSMEDSNRSSNPRSLSDLGSVGCKSLVKRPKSDRLLDRNPAGPAPGAPCAKNHQKARNKNHRPDDFVQVRLDDWHIAEKIPRRDNAAHPQGAAGDVEQREFAA